MGETQQIKIKLEVRFKNQGLDSIEVQDNGSGISPENYESLALKHYTSKLSTYADLNTLETFGFRGEALSSLCALSRFTVTTCLRSDAPKGTKLEFDISGKLKGTSVVAAQTGTTVTVENLFQSLPVRRRELERNIKREWGKVITLLNQYACVQTGVKFTVSQQPNKGKRIVLFSTKGNKTTRENIINVFGAKTMTALVALDLKLQLEPTGGPGQKQITQGGDHTQDVLILGFVSRPVHGEGRQTPDRQMFYVNSRPCGLPQFAKVFNEVYRSFNSSQSPFIFADIQLDTHLYDVNVSPDKRTILLHDQSRMLDNLRDVLTELFEKQEYTLPMSQITPLKQTPFKKPALLRQQTIDEEPAQSTAPSHFSLSPDEREEPSAVLASDSESSGTERIRNLAAAKALAREAQLPSPTIRSAEDTVDPQEEAGAPAEENAPSPSDNHASYRAEVRIADDGKPETVFQNKEPQEIEKNSNTGFSDEASSQETDFLARLANMKRSFLPASLQDEMTEDDNANELPIPAIAKTVKPPDNAPLSISATRASKRPSQEVATITIGDHTVTSIIGTPPKRPRKDEATPDQRDPQKRSKTLKDAAALPSFGGRLTQMFSAATPRQQQSIEEDECMDADADLDERSHDRSNSASESDRESLEDTKVESDGDDDYDDDAKSSPLFMEQDEVDQLPASPLDERTQEPNDMDDEEYVNDEADNEAIEETKDTSILEAASQADHEPGEENQKRTQAFLKGGTKGKYSTQSLLQRAKVDEDLLDQRLRQWARQMERFASSKEGQADGAGGDELDSGLEAENAEEKLSLAIHKGDFGKMKIVGQFNLGFILAVRPRSTRSRTTSSDITGPTKNDDDDDELFIIDQHASDEKFNFERLQSVTVVQSQRLVRPKPLELTAVEEEIVLENQAALEKNGFIVSVDESGDEPVGSRCQLLSLPLSRETTFSLADLEELISLLGDNPTTTTTINSTSDDDALGGSGTTNSRYIPRPSKIRKMFAMRACRCSIMIGKALSQRQMETVVRHMGGMEKPWNCPHGRPTMRHLCGLGTAWEQRGWREGDSGEDYVTEKRTTDWAGYVRQNRTQ